MPESVDFTPRNRSRSPVYHDPDRIFVETSENGPIHVRYTLTPNGFEYASEYLPYIHEIRNGATVTWWHRRAIYKLVDALKYTDFANTYKRDRPRKPSLALILKLDQAGLDNMDSIRALDTIRNMYGDFMHAFRRSRPEWTGPFSTDGPRIKNTFGNNIVDPGAPDGHRRFFTTRPRPFQNNAPAPSSIGEGSEPPDPEDLDDQNLLGQRRRTRQNYRRFRSGRKRKRSKRKRTRRSKKKKL